MSAVGYSGGLSNKCTRVEMTMDIISAVQKRKPMWDASRLKKNANFMWDLWKEVAEEVGADVTDVRARWKHLRSYFASCYKDHIRTGVRPTWRFYKTMTFLSGVVEKNMKEDEEKEVAAREANIDEGSFNFDDFPEWNDEIVLNFPRPDGNLDDSLSPIDTVVAPQETLQAIGLVPKLEPMDDSPGSCPTSIDFQQAKIEFSGQQEPPKKNRNIMKDSEKKRIVKDCDCDSGTSNGQTTNPRAGKRKILADESDSLPQKASSNAWLAIERRKLELLEKEVAEDTNPDLSFFKSLLPILKFFSEPQKLRVRMAINQIILREYNQVKDQALRNCFQVQQ